MKTFCPRHEDTHPSCEVYPEGGFCFAGCGSIPLEELGVEPGEVPPKEKEDLELKYKYIVNLDETIVRGFPFFHDLQGFYIQYPESLYYAYRRYDNNPRYLYPTGHQAPLFWCRKQHHNTLWLVEGQLNALSIAKAFPKADVCSPGSAGMFDSKQLRKHLIELSKYSSIVIVVDADNSGIKAVIEAKGLLMSTVKYVSYVLMEEDANDVMLKHGSEYLAEEVKSKMS